MQRTPLPCPMRQLPRRATLVGASRHHTEPSLVVGEVEKRRGPGGHSTTGGPTRAHVVRSRRTGRSLGVSNGIRNRYYAQIAVTE